MIQVSEAEQLIFERVLHFGTESIPLEQASNRILAEAIYADRDFPPFNRVSMDGIAFNYDDFQSGNRSFPIRGIASAGLPQLQLSEKNACIEVMTGAICPDGCDTVVRYEDLELQGDLAKIRIEAVQYGQNVHNRGFDRKQGDLLIEPGVRIGPAEIGVMATTGFARVQVMRLPRIGIISNGDELVEIDQQPLAHQIRKSNAHTMAALLRKYGAEGELQHWSDEPTLIKNALQKALEKYDVLLLSGGVSMGKFDYLPTAFEEAGVKKIFHKVQQRPGKPFWFGETMNHKLVFAFPGNPVSTFMCAIRYFVPWLERSTGVSPVSPLMVQLEDDFYFRPSLTYFLQCRLKQVGTHFVAQPTPGHGSGDLANLLDADGFLELPSDRKWFFKGECFPFWSFR